MECIFVQLVSTALQITPPLYKNLTPQVLYSSSHLESTIITNLGLTKIRYHNRMFLMSSKALFKPPHPPVFKTCALSYFSKNTKMLQILTRHYQRVELNLLNLWLMTFKRSSYFRKKFKYFEFWICFYRGRYNQHLKRCKHSKLDWFSVESALIFGVQMNISLLFHCFCFVDTNKAALIAQKSTAHVAFRSYNQMQF